LELLPPTNIGNSMLEFKAALLCLDFQVEAQMLTINELANIRVPSILLIPTPEKHYAALERRFSHYVLLWPLADEKIQIINYPREPKDLSATHLVRHLRNIGIKKIPVLLCGKQGQSLGEMLYL